MSKSRTELPRILLGARTNRGIRSCGGPGAGFALGSMADLKWLTQKLRNGLNLTEEECFLSADALTRPEIEASAKGDFLEALHGKGESVGEVAAFARHFRACALNPGLEAYADDAIDIVGTGGTGTLGYNVSSTTAFIVAAGGVPVLKHGNRAITSQSGSADFLGALGIRMETDPARLRAAVEALNFCFFFAPAFHPAFKEIVPVRKALAERGIRTIFNILGPLINPARPAHQLLGVFHRKWVKPLADTLHQLGLRNGVACTSEIPGPRFIDELTTAGPNHVHGFGESHALAATWDPASLGFVPGNAAELAGGSAAHNLTLLEDILDGQGPTALVDTLVLNAGVAFHITGKTASRDEGFAYAREVLLGGQLRAWLAQVKAFHADTDA